MKFVEMFKRLLKDDDGPTAVEYAVMLALILAAAMVGIQSFGNAAANTWGNNNDGLSAAFDNAN